MAEKKKKKKGSASSNGAGYGGDMTDHTVKLDWDTVGEIAAKGRYGAKITGAQYKKAKSNAHMIEMSIEIVSAQDPANVKAVGKSINFVNLVFSQDGAFLAKDLFKSLDIAPPSEVNRQKLEELAERLLGLEVGIVVTHREYEGKTRPNITGFFGLAAEDEDEEDDEIDEDDEDEEEEDEDDDEEEDEDDDDEDEEDDEDEDEDDKPAVTAKSKKNGTPAPTPTPPPAAASSKKKKKSKDKSARA